MPRMSSKFVKMRIDLEGTIKRNDPIIRKAFFKAIKAFLREALIRIPLWSGMSRGSLIPVVNFVNSKDPGDSVLITLSPLVAKFSRVSQGMSLGTFSFTFTNGEYQFVMEPKVPHFYYLDRYHNYRNEKSPWESFKKARAIYQQVLKRELKANLKNPVIVKTIVSKGSKP